MKYDARRIAVAWLVAAMLVTCVLTAAAKEPGSRLDTRRMFSIPVQSLASALLSFSSQADMQVMTSSVDLNGQTSTEVRGERSAREALTTLLRGTGLEFHPVSDTAVSIEPIKTREERSRREIPGEAHGQ